jgi:predicted transcriptional regulator
MYRKDERDLIANSWANSSPLDHKGCVTPMLSRLCCKALRSFHGTFSTLVRAVRTALCLFEAAVIGYLWMHRKDEHDLIANSLANSSPLDHKGCATPMLSRLCCKALRSFPGTFSTLVRAVRTALRLFEAAVIGYLWMHRKDERDLIANSLANSSPLDHKGCVTHILRSSEPCHWLHWREAANRAGKGGKRGKGQGQVGWVCRGGGGQRWRPGWRFWSWWPRQFRWWLVGWCSAAASAAASSS